jgi:hypothetical protein
VGSAALGRAYERFCESELLSRVLEPPRSEFGS